MDSVLKILWPAGPLVGLVVCLIGAAVSAANPVRGQSIKKHGLRSAIGSAVLAWVGIAIWANVTRNPPSDTGLPLLLMFSPVVTLPTGFALGAIFGMLLPIPDTKPRKASAPPPGAG